MREGKSSLFGSIATLYGLFYGYQKRHYGRILESVIGSLDLSKYQSVLDVGSGTGAFCAAWQEKGFSVTGIEPEPKMIAIAQKKTGADSGIRFLKADVLKGLPFCDRSFDISIASYVAHGFSAQERQIMYSEMSRVTKHLVIIHDFNERRSSLVDIIETLEGGDYFNFIKSVQQEVANVFAGVQFVDVGTRARWYIGRVNSETK